jgi:hypothetical protein
MRRHIMGEQRKIHEIAREIDTLWRDKHGKPAKARWCADAYLQPMFSLNTMEDMYGLDTAVSVVLYFLANAAQFRGADARRLKQELRDQLPARYR